MSKITKKRLQKIASIATTGATVLWLSGISMLMPAMAATYANGTLIKASGTNDVFVVDNNLKVPVRSLEVASQSGYDLSKTKTLSASAFAAVPDAMLIKTATNPDVYKLEKNFKRKLASIEIFNSYSLDWGKISTVSQPAMDSFSYAPIFQHGADLYWKDANNVLHKFLTMDSFTGNGYNTRDLISVNDMEFGSFGIGIDINPNVIPIPPTPSGTGLSVSLASDTPVSSSVPGKASGVTLLKFNLTAGTDGAVAVPNITVKRVGVGEASDFANVYLYDGATRLTSGRSVNSTTNEAAFASLGLSIPAGSTKTLSVVVDMKTAGATAGNVDAFEIASASAITTTAAINGVFPVMGNLMTVAAADGGTLTVARGSDPANPNVGQTGATIAEFTLNATTEDINVKRIALYNGGTISRSNLTNFKLYQGTTLLATTAGLDSKDLVTFDMTSSPYSLPKSITRTFTVKADIGGNSKPDDTIVLYVDQISDVYATGATYGFGVQPTITSFDSDTNNSVSVNGGTITVTTSGPQTGNIAKGGNDIDFMDFSIASAANAQIKTMRVEFHRTSTDLDATDATDTTTNYITDVKVVDRDTNAVLTSSVDINAFDDIGTNAGVYHSFTDVIDLASGQTRNFKITADFSTSVSTGTFYVTLGTTASSAFSSTSIKNTDNNQYITDIVPSTAIAGQQQTTSAASLTLSMATSPSSQSYIKGASSVESAGFIFTAGTGAEVKVTSIKLSGYVADDASQTLAKYSTSTMKVTDLVSSITLWDGATQLGTAKSFNTSGEATFDNFSLIVPAGTAKTLVVKANTSNSATLDPATGADDDLARYAIDVTTAADDIAAVTNDDAQTEIDATPNLPNAAASTPKTVITLRESGSIVAAQDAGTPSSALVMAGATGVTFAKVQFSAVYEEMKITKMQVAVPTPSSYADNIVSVSVEGGGQPETSMAISSGGLANFTGLNIIVPKDGSTVVTMKASLSTITGGADSGDTVQLEITSTNFEAIGTGTSNTKKTTATGLAAVGSSAGGNDMYVKATIPTVASVASPAAGSLNNGTQAIYKFTVTNTAPTGGYDVSFKKVKFDLSVNNSVYVNGEAGPTITDLKLYRSGESTAVNNVGFFDTTATTATHVMGKQGQTSTVAVDKTAGTTTTAFIMILNDSWAATGSGEETIAAGTSRTYEVKATVAGVGNGASSKDTIGIRVTDPIATDSTPYGLVYSATAGHYVDLTTTGVGSFHLV